MPRFLVIKRVMALVEVTVDADDREEADDKADALLEYSYCDDVTVEEILGTVRVMGEGEIR